MHHILHSKPAKRAYLFLADFPHMILAACLALMIGASCAPAPGDACEASTDCPSSFLCDTTAPDGYCLIPNCQRGDCPDSSICVEFDRDITFCMQSCSEDSECRDGYACRTDLFTDDTSTGFCYVPARAPASS